MFKYNKVRSVFPLFLLALLYSSGCVAQGEASSAASSEASSAPAEKLIYANPNDRDNDLLVKAFTAITKADEIQWLETPHEKIVSLLKISEARKTKGALLIIHSPETPQLWPASLETLRRNLPIYGWTTAALPLPVRYSPPPPQVVSASSSSSEEASSAASVASSVASLASSSASSSVIPRSDIIAERVEAAVAQLNKTGQFNLVVLVDNSSAPDALAALYKKINAGTSNRDTIDGPVQALVLVNMQQQEPLTKEQLSAIFSVANLPVLDVFFSPENSDQLEARRRHHAEAMRNNLKDYQQILLLPQQQATIDDKQSFWVGKIHGFMERKAEGNQIDGQTKNVK